MIFKTLKRSKIDPKCVLKATWEKFLTSGGDKSEINIWSEGDFVSNWPPIFCKYDICFGPDDATSTKTETDVPFFIVIRAKTFIIPNFSSLPTVKCQKSELSFNLAKTETISLNKVCLKLKVNPSRTLNFSNKSNSFGVMRHPQKNNASFLTKLQFFSDKRTRFATWNLTNSFENWGGN